jgi:N-acetylglucosaminylphosphatidylinositol deacetylase
MEIIRPLTPFRGFLGLNFIVAMFYHWVFSCIGAYVLALVVNHLRPSYKEKIASVKNILLVVAHPDDECMFFAPSILGLNKLLSSHPSSKIHVVSLSTGNSLWDVAYTLTKNYNIGNHDGLGDVRKKELVESCKVLGVSDDNVYSVTNE